jgi:hypothetical protein
MKIFQTYSGARQKAFLADGVVPYDYSRNKGTEYEIFKDVSKNGRSYLSGEEVWGVLSWKFDVKCHIGLHQFRREAELLIEDGADCVFINPMIGAEAVFSNVWEQGVAYGHKGMERMVPFLVERLYLRPVDMLMFSDTFAFCNFFVARDRFWRHYFNFVDSVLADLEMDDLNGGEAGLLASGPSHYSKQPTLSMTPFIVERLFSTFVPQSGLKVRSIGLGVDVYKAKFGALLGNTLHMLSALKNVRDKRGGDDHLRWVQLSRELISGRGMLMMMHLDDPDIGLVDIGLEAEKISQSLGSKHALRAG